MKYLGLAYYTPEKFAAMAPADVEAGPVRAGSRPGVRC